MGSKKKNLFYGSEFPCNTHCFSLCFKNHTSVMIQILKMTNVRVRPSSKLSRATFIIFFCDSCESLMIPVCASEARRAFNKRTNSLIFRLEQRKIFPEINLLKNSLEYTRNLAIYFFVFNVFFLHCV